MLSRRRAYRKVVWTAKSRSSHHHTWFYILKEGFWMKGMGGGRLGLERRERNRFFSFLEREWSFLLTKIKLITYLKYYKKTSLYYYPKKTSLLVLF
jgi:hypothetical protein